MENWATGKLGNEEWRSRKKGNTKLMSGSNSTLTFEPPEQQSSFFAHARPMTL